MEHHINLKSIQAAAKRIAPYVKKTPIMDSIYLQAISGLEVYLKLENLNFSGSFKIRGATNKLLLTDKSKLAHGVVATSAGNHAQGVARTALQLGVPATIFMPKTAPLVKAESTRALGAKVILEGETYDDAEAAAKEWQKENKALMVHPFSDPDVIAGQGTVAIEILQQMPDVEVVLIPTGGGGLLSGMACAIKQLKPEVQVIGVQSSTYPALTNRFRAKSGLSQQIAPSSTIADGIAVKSVNDLNYALIRKYVDEMWVVSEDSIAAAVMSLMERDHLLSEGAGAAGVAALLDLHHEAKEKFKGKKCVVIVSGGNIDVNLLSRITTQGLIFSGRLMRIRINLPDLPGGLAALLARVGDLGANLQNVSHNRTFGAPSYKEVEVDLDLETTNLAHQVEIKKDLRAKGYRFEVLWQGKH